MKEDRDLYFLRVLVYFFCLICAFVSISSILCILIYSHIKDYKKFPSMDTNVEKSDKDTDDSLTETKINPYRCI